MEIWTQDMVASIPGAEELLQKTTELFPQSRTSTKFIEKGFEVHVEGLPFFFTVSCFEDIGWNVFLTSLSGSLDDDEQTDTYYHALEDTIDSINETYFSEDEDNDTIPYNFFKLKSVSEDTMKQMDSLIIEDDTDQYVLRLGIKNSTELPIEMGYSKLFRRWYYEIKHRDRHKNLFQNQAIKTYLEKVDYLIGTLNHSM